jgi:hypothetical protein
MSIVEVKYRVLLPRNVFQGTQVPIPAQSTTARHLVASLNGTHALHIRQAGNLVLLAGTVGWQGANTEPTRVVYEIYRDLPGTGNAQLIFSVEDAIELFDLNLQRSGASFMHVDVPPRTGEVRYFLFVRRVQGTAPAFIIGRSRSQRSRSSSKSGFRKHAFMTRIMRVFYLGNMPRQVGLA